MFWVRLMSLPRGTLCALFLGVAAASTADIESKRLKCMRKKHHQPARRANDLNTTFASLLEGTAYAELGAKVLSTDPWVIYFENFISEDEVVALEKGMFSGKTKFNPSPAGGDDSKHQARHSETAFCTDECDRQEAVQTMRLRASKIVAVPPENFDFSQALRYKEGMFYKEHHDNHPTFHYSPCGTRIFTYFVYLSDDGLEGGATYFPRLQLTAPAKRGAAVLFVDTKDRNPMETDMRTVHESLPVTKGEKRGVNMWLYQYNYRDYWRMGCTSIELADKLGRYGKAASPVQPSITFENNAKTATLYFFQAPDREAERYLGSAEAGSTFSVNSAEGNVLLVRSARQGGKTFKEYSVRPSAKQVVRLGKKREEL